MLLVFQVCFGVGLGYAVLAFVLDHVFDFLDFGGGEAEVDLDLDANASLEGAGEGSGDISISPFKPAIIAAFLVVFGGIGMLVITRFSFYIAFCLAAMAGLAIAYFMYRFIYVPLYKAQNTSAVEKQSLIGRPAKVTEAIPQGQYGKIVYIVNGNTYSAPAKSEGGGGITRNTEVEIVSIIKNTYYVRERV